MSRLATLVVTIHVALIGCATTRGTLDVQIELPPNPSSEIVFQVPEITVDRHFHPDPPDPSIPSLKNAEDIDDVSITERAIARKRNSYGMAMGDILLPEGRTVAGLASDAIVRGFRSAGYRVASADDADFARALPVRARVDQFWAWVTPGFWAMAIEFETRMHIVTPSGRFADGEDVRGYIRLKSAAVSSEKWATTIDRGLEDFSTTLADALKLSASTPVDEHPFQIPHQARSSS
jgi:hypothetical protein